jgi:uncharacterized protein YuzB (UPF0349 family)
VEGEHCCGRLAGGSRYTGATLESRRVVDLLTFECTSGCAGLIRAGAGAVSE